MGERDKAREYLWICQLESAISFVSSYLTNIIRETRRNRATRVVSRDHGARARLGIRSWLHDLEQLQVLNFELILVDTDDVVATDVQDLDLWKHHWAEE